MKSQIHFEICTETIERSLEAQTSGAYRIEFCNDLLEGGITPSPAQITLARKLIDIKLHVIIRPRGGNFVYNDLDFEVMKEDIHFCGKAGVDGVVIGMLLPDNTIDKKRCKELIQIAGKYNMSVTFHRAFDETSDIFQALEDVVKIGCDRILTSGGKETVPEGIENIRTLIEKANDRIVILPGSGINKENVEHIIDYTGTKEIHGTFKNGFPERMKK